jgi:RNA polymerase sigma factor (sigma-70 family)
MEPLRNAPPLFEVLTQQAANGDNRAFQQLYDLIAGRMYSLCLRYAGNSNDANDCFQEGFVKLYRHLSGFRGEGSFEGWARRIFVGTCIDFIKKKKAVFTVISDDFDIAADGLNGYDKLTNDDLMKTISTMPDGYRTVINLYLVEGYNHKEIGELLNISEEGSRSQLFRARVYLQKLFKETHGEQI